MSSERASVFDHGPDIDISGFEPRTAAKPAAQPDQVKAVSETANFVSREPIRATLHPAPATPGCAPVAPRLRAAQREKGGAETTHNATSAERPKSPSPASQEAQKEPITREPRRHRTGRNTQFNIKARADTIERFYALADRSGWVLGETFERAVAELERNATNGNS
jgi:hypothetical protein